MLLTLTCLSESVQINLRRFHRKMGDIRIRECRRSRQCSTHPPISRTVFEPRPQALRNLQQEKWVQSLKVEKFRQTLELIGWPLLVKSQLVR